MKLFKILMLACFLLMTASVVGAAETDLPNIEVEVATTEAADLNVPEVSEEAATAKQDCENQAGGLFQPEWITPSAAPNSCGSCSSSNCKGALRGQACWTGSGWGWCNIYSGGFRCSTGGWECQCGTGPLP